MLRAIATRVLSAGIAWRPISHRAGALLGVAGTVLAVALSLAALRGAVPLGPLLLWVSWMALFGVAAVALTAVLRARRLELALQREQRRFRALAKAVPAGVCQFDTADGLVFSNAVCEALFGATPQTCGGALGLRGLHPHDRARLRERWGVVRPDCHAFAEEFRLVLDGRQRWVSLKTIPVADGLQRGYVCCLAERRVKHDAPPSPCI